MKEALHKDSPNVLLRTRVTDILSWFGKSVGFSRGNMCFSPFRDEKTPSFQISRDGTAWFDFGLGKGGGVLDLVKALALCGTKEAFSILSKIQYGQPLTYDENYVDSLVKSFPQASLSKPKFKVCSVEDITSVTLLGYALFRGIPPEVLRQYCKQVTVSLTFNSDKRYTYIGFPDCKGNWVLRNPSSIYGKRCTGSHPSYISAVSSGCSSVLVFEGFFDFLSHVVMYGFSNEDVCVLNSVANLEKALGYISSHKEVNLWLDNDNAGRQAVETLTQRLSEDKEEKILIQDKSFIYRPCKDVNEFLQKECHKKTYTQNY